MNSTTVATYFESAEGNVTVKFHSLPNSSKDENMSHENENMCSDINDL